MATAQISSGYGPSASTSASIPVFDGRREHFDDFVYKIKATLFELGNEDVLQPDFQQLFESTLRKATLRDADVTEASSKLELLNLKKRQVARIIISRLSPTVTDAMRKVLPESEHYNASAIWCYLVKTYKMSASARRAAENPELAALSILQLKWNQDRPLLDHLRHVQQRVMTCLTHVKFSKTESARRFFVSIVLRNVLDNIGDIARYRSIREKQLQALLMSDEFSMATALETMISEVESIDALIPPQQRQRSKQNKQRFGGHPSTANTAAPTAASGPVKKQFNGDQRNKSKGKPHQPKVSCVDTCVSDDGESVINIDCYLSALTNTHPLTSSKRERIFLVDSGATHHCVREKALFSAFRPGKHVVRVADNKVISSLGKGEVTVQVVSVDGQRLSLTLRDVFFVPSLATNIFSTNRFGQADPENCVSGCPKGIEDSLDYCAAEQRAWVGVADLNSSGEEGNFCASVCCNCVVCTSITNISTGDYSVCTSIANNSLISYPSPSSIGYSYTAATVS